jgi:hypothetical protein
MIGWQLPADTVGADLKLVVYPQMAAHGFGAKAAFETHHIVGLH